MGEEAAAARVVRLADYRRNAWSAADVTWEQVAAGAVASLAAAATTNCLVTTCTLRVPLVPALAALDAALTTLSDQVDAAFGARTETV